MSTRFKIVVEYHGARFVGWQVQPNGRSVQATLDAAAEKLVGHPVRVMGSGRTDSGVHALGQVAAFDTDATRTPRELVLGMNALLPDDVSVVSAEVVPAEFDPRRWAFAKRYRYAFLDREARSPMACDRSWFVRGRLDHEAMDVAARTLSGTHDYTSFRAAGCGAATAVRTIDGFEVERSGDLVLLHARGHGFLRHMVRIVAGTLTEVGLGRRPVEWPAEVLATRDRSRAGRTAPAHGLTLMSVQHGNGRRDYGEASHSLDTGGPLGDPG